MASKTKQNGSAHKALTLEDLAVRSESVLVGSVQLTLTEPTWFTLKEITKVLLNENLTSNIKKLTGLAQQAFDEAKEVTEGEEGEEKTVRVSAGSLVAKYLDAIVDVIREGVIPLLGDQMLEIPVALLDTDRNRVAVAKHMGVDAEDAFMVDENGESESFRAWLRHAITPVQYDYVIEKFQGLRGWAELGKRIAGRFGLGSLGKLTEMFPQA